VAKQAGTIATTADFRSDFLSTGVAKQASSRFETLQTQTRLARRPAEQIWHHKIAQLACFPVS
jgi:hypothetical protein